MTNGYGPTTIKAVAERADLAVQTVYATFTNKRRLLGEVLDVAIAGDDAAVTVNQRDWMQAAFTAATGAERLRAYAGAVRQIYARAGDVFTVVEQAAAVDANMSELASIAESRRRSGATSIIDAVAAVAELREGLTRDDAIDVMWVMNSPATFRQLVRGAGWTLDHYQEWLAEAFVRELLGSGALIDE